MKKFTSALLTLALILSLTACGDNTEPQNSPAAEETANAQIEVGNSNENKDDNQQKEENKENADHTVISGTSVAVQETVVMEDTCEFYVDFATVTGDVIPTNASGWYSHYQADNDKVFVDICVAYKNLSEKNREADKILSGTLFFGGKYQYTGFAIVEEKSRSNFTYANITSIDPLSMEYLHYLFEVPAEVENSDGALTALLNIEGSPYVITVREGVEGEVAAVNENAVVKTKGEVAEGEVVLIENKGEFFIDYSAITDDVIPRQASGWYSHYQADDGKVYVDFCVAFKNRKAKKVGADEVITATLTYAGKYKYGGFSMIEKGDRSDFTYSNITNIAPLTTEYLHYLFEVPAEVEDSAESIEIEFAIGGNTYSYRVR